MRALRLSLAGVVILVLLAGVTGMALAQKPEEATWSYVTGQHDGEAEWVETEPLGASRLDGSVEYQDEWSYIMPVEWSDPRLPEAMSRLATSLHPARPARGGPYRLREAVPSTHLST